MHNETFLNCNKVHRRGILGNCEIQKGLTIEISKAKEEKGEKEGFASPPIRAIFGPVRRSAIVCVQSQIRTTFCGEVSPKWTVDNCFYLIFNFFFMPTFIMGCLTAIVF